MTSPITRKYEVHLPWIRRREEVGDDVRKREEHLMDECFAYDLSEMIRESERRRAGTKRKIDIKPRKVCTRHATSSSCKEDALGRPHHKWSARCSCSWTAS
jgi:hypothetical protein